MLKILREVKHGSGGVPTAVSRQITTAVCGGFQFGGMPVFGR